MRLGRHDCGQFVDDDEDEDKSDRSSRSVLYDDVGQMKQQENTTHAL